MGKDVAMDRYSDTGEHGLIGDLQMAALVNTDGTVDWLCRAHSHLDHGPDWVEPAFSAGRRGS